MDCAVCGVAAVAVCARCKLLGYCGREHQRADWPAHKIVCRKAESAAAPAPTCQQIMLADAAAAAPASLAATAALPPIPAWNVVPGKAPPARTMKA